MFTWRLVLARVATLTELETTWSFDDAMRAHAVLDYRDALRAVPRGGK